MNGYRSFASFAGYIIRTCRQMLCVSHSTLDSCVGRAKKFRSQFIFMHFAMKMKLNPTNWLEFLFFRSDFCYFFLLLLKHVTV